MKKPRVLCVMSPDWYGVARLARILRDAGCHVSLLGHPRSFAARSGFVDALVPGYWEPAANVELLREHLLDGASYDWIILADDPTVRAAVRRRGEGWLDGWFPVDPASENPERLISKARFLEAARAAGLPVPASRAATGAAAIRDAARAIGFPVIVKPSVGGGGVGAFAAGGPEELERLLPREGSFVVQRFIAGRSGGTCVLFDRGRPAWWLSSLRARARPEPFGPASARAAVEVPEIEGILAKLGGMLGARGLFEIDWILPVDGGGPMILELNPRPAPYLSLAETLGADLSGAIRAFLAGRPCAPVAAAGREAGVIGLFPEDALGALAARDWRLSARWLTGAAGPLPWSDPVLFQVFGRLAAGALLRPPPARPLARPETSRPLAVPETPPPGRPRQGPRISVIICTYNRRDSLKELLEGLLRQKAPPGCSYEILIVDNNSSDGTKELMSASSAEFEGKLRYLFEPIQGKSFALNRGIGEARGEILAFTDDDCLVESDYIARVDEAFRDGGPETGVVGGKVLPRWAQGRAPDWLAAFSAGTQSRPVPWRGGDKPDWLDLFFHGSIGMLDRGDVPYEIDAARGLNENVLFFGANMMLRKEVLERHGGFDTAKKRTEDAEICSRLFRAGVKGRYAPRIVVRHKLTTPITPGYYYRRAFLDAMYDETDADPVGGAGISFRRIQAVLSLSARACFVASVDQKVFYRSQACRNLGKMARDLRDRCSPAARLAGRAARSFRRRRRPYDAIVNLGGDCQVAHQLSVHRLRPYALPFDHVAISAGGVRAMLERGFDGFLDAQNLILNREEERVKDVLYGTQLFHDFAIGDEFLNDHESVREKYRRRIDRLGRVLKSSRKILFIRNKVSRQEALDLDATLARLYPRLDYLIVALDGTGEMKEDWRLPRIRNFFLRQKTPYLWSGDDAAWREIFAALGLESMAEEGPAKE